MRMKFTGKLIISILVIILLMLFFKIFNVYNILQKQIYKQEYSEYVNKYAEINEIDPMWIYAIIKVESNFDKLATSNKGAKGLMQLMDSTALDIAKELNIEDFELNMLYDPEINIMIGTKYFNKLLEKYNENYYLAIAAYNGGIGNVDNWIDRGVIEADASNIENIPYKETNMYVRKTIRAYTVYVELYKI
ncbi:MAG: lytic transglycosylase domain-containing protein [Clostridia bacterium]|nr:lytic transglycosylase domain-containing protein [Clostridia bacterium]